MFWNSVHLFWCYQFHAGFPEELRDFNITPIAITFQPDSSETINTTLDIVDDSVNEPVEFFAVRLDPQMVDGVSNPDAVIVPNVSLCRIEDNDCKSLYHWGHPECTWITLTV